MKQFLIITNKESGKVIEFPRRGTAFGIRGGILWVDNGGCLHRFSLENHEYRIEVIEK